MRETKGCRKCGNKTSFVYESRTKDGCVVRRRKCLKCGFKWTTIEVDYWDAMNKMSDESC